ncbi:leucine-rich repeat domain-containing protein, partial [Thermodesulfovibrionales bacterium]|nr:leucine-rich repeat domain-containing protein [Thermodesulfovibrionales bacterium]
MKKRVSLGLFGILVISLLVFAGSSWVSSDRILSAAPSDEPFSLNDTAATNLWDTCRYDSRMIDTSLFKKRMHEEFLETHIFYPERREALERKKTEVLCVAPAVVEPLADKVVTIPDPNLAAAIREALGIGPGVNIYRSDLERLIRFEADDRDISNLTGLEYAVNLQGLSLGGNQITDIAPLAGLTGLGTLWLWNNQITDIAPLAGLTKLERLSLSGNRITDITPL